MKYTWIDAYLLNKPGVTKDLQEDWNWERFQIGGKLFAAVCRDDDNSPYYITLKLEPLEGEFWRKQYDDIIPGYYMNKAHWNSVKANGEVPDDTLKELLDKSYQLVLGGLSKKKQREILDAGGKGDLLSCCGLDCGKCLCYGNPCQGCNTMCGKVFHAPEGSACPIYSCCKIKNKFSSCGTCSLLPCPTILNTRDPSLTDEEFMETVSSRVKRLRGN